MNLKTRCVGQSGPEALFDDFTRTEMRYAAQGERPWAYLNLSARPGVAAAREMMQAWFAAYPEPKTDLCERLRSEDSHRYRSAFFELYVHELLRRSGHTVDCHPDTETAKRPDFMVRRDDQPAFYVEVILPRGKDEATPAAHSRWDDLCRAINTLDVPNGFLWVSQDVHPERPPKLAQIRKKVAAWVKTIEEAGGVEATDELDDLPCLVLDAEDAGGSDIKVYYVPRAVGAPPDPNKSAIGVYGERSTAFMVDETGTVTGALKTKANRYGPLDLPYIVAIGVPDMFVDMESVFMALLGRSYGFGGGNDVVSFQMQHRNGDGVWHNGAQPRMTNVSAVLIVFDPSPWSLAAKPPTLIHHPWAARPLDTGSLPIDQYIPDHTTGLFHRREGGAIADFLGLPQPWPIPDPNT